jgi:hypothetical protein
MYPVIHYLNNKYWNLYLPNLNITVDESLTLWKGRLSFRQFMSLKAANFGIKAYEVCESPAMFGLFSFISDEHGTNESVCGCRNKQKYSNCIET